MGTEAMIKLDCKALLRESMDAVVRQVEEMKADGLDASFSNMALHEASWIFLVGGVAVDGRIQPAVFEGAPNCLQIVFHSQEASRRLEVELSEDGTRYTSLIYQDLNRMEDFGPMPSDVQWLTPLLLRLVEPAEVVQPQPEMVFDSSEENGLTPARNHRPLSLAA